MRWTLGAAVLAVTLAACSAPAPPDTEASLAADPARLRELLALCRDDRAERFDEATCATAERAWRRRFMGDRGARYTPVN